MKTAATALLCLLMLPGHFSYAQAGEKWYAEEPIGNAVETARDSNACIANLVSPAEISMMNRVRANTEAILGDFTRKYNWELNELYEQYGSTSYRADKPAPPPSQWPPHYFLMVYQFVVNADSLKAWEDYRQRYTQQLSDQFDRQRGNAAAHQDEIKVLQDSMEYYITEMGNLGSDRQKIFASGNQKEKDAYYRQLDFYKKKIDDFTERISRFNNSNYENIDEEKKVADIHFHDASIVELTIAVNSQRVSPTGKFISSENEPRFSSVNNYSNENPDMLDKFNFYLHSRSFSLLLLGAWRASDHNHFSALYSANRANTDHSSPKRIPSYQVQDIAITISGNKEATRKLIKEADWTKIKNMLVK